MTTQKLMTDDELAAIRKRADHAFTSTGERVTLAYLDRAKLLAEVDRLRAIERRTPLTEAEARRSAEDVARGLNARWQIALGERVIEDMARRIVRVFAASRGDAPPEVRPREHVAGGGRRNVDGSRRAPALTEAEAQTLADAALERADSGGHADRLYEVTRLVLAVSSGDIPREMRPREQTEEVKREDGRPAAVPPGHAWRYDEQVEEWCLVPAPPPVECVAALVTDDEGRVLLVCSAKPGRGWELPGGKVNHGEGWHAAAEREVLEETGVKVTGAMTTEATITGTPKPGAEFASVIHVVTGKGRGQPVAGDDASDASWWTPDGVLDLFSAGDLSDLDSREVLLKWARESSRA